MPIKNETQTKRNKLVPRTFRIQRRLEARNGSGVDTLILNQEDLANLDAFEKIVVEATEILQLEIAAVKGGDFAIISKLIDNKTSALKSIELQMPLVEPIIRSKHKRAEAISDRLAKLKSVSIEDSDLLKRMAIAASTVVKELNRATDRHSLNGLYGNSGKKITGSVEIEQRIDKRF
jgi:hypothetical protein